LAFVIERLLYRPLPTLLWLAAAEIRSGDPQRNGTEHEVLEGRGVGFLPICRGKVVGETGIF